jgi:hypothetical protein
MSRAIAEASDETSKQARAIRELGLSVADLQALSPDQQFAEIAEAMSHLRDQSEKTRLAVELFGRGAYDIIGVLNAGKAGLESSAKSVEGFGLALDRVDSQKVLDANKAMHEFDKVVKGASVQLTAELAPYLIVITQHIADMGRESGGFREQIKKAVETGVYGLGVLADATRVLELGWKGFKVVALELEGAAVGAFIAIGNWIQRTVEDIRLAGKVMGAIWDLLWNGVKAGGIGVLSFFEGFVHTTEELLAGMIDGIADAAGYVSADLEESLRGVSKGIYESTKDASDATAKQMDKAAADMQNSAAAVGDAWREMLDPLRDAGENTPPAIAGWQRSVTDATANAKADFDALWSSAKPSASLMDGLNAALDQVNAKAEEAVSKLRGPNSEKSSYGQDWLNAEAAGRSEGLRILTESLNLELLAENDKYQKEQEDAQENFDKLRASKVTQDAVMAQLAATHAARLKGINSEAVKSELVLWETGMKGKLAVSGEYLGILATLQNSKNREMFEVGKFAAEGQAVISTAAGVAKTFEQLGYYALFGPAEIVAAAGLAQIQSIRSASFGGGGGGSVSVPGGGSATTTTPAPTGQPTSGDFRGAGTTVSLSLGDDGDLVSVGAVRRLFEKFNRVIGNGAKIVSN